MLGKTDSTERAADIAARSLLSRFVERTAADPQRPAVRSKSRGIWREATWAEYRRHVERLALGLQRLGIGDGAAVVVLGRPTPGWLYLDLAAQSIGALPLATHATMAAASVARIIQAVDPAVVMLTRRDQLDRFIALEPADSRVRQLIVGGVDVRKDADERVLTLAEVEALGAEESQSDPDRWASLAASRPVDAPAAIALSAGTTGEGRLVVLTDKNLLSAWSWLAALPTPPGPGDRIVSSMALGQLAERGLAQIAPIVFGSVVHFPEDELSLTEARREIRPTIYFALQHVWETEAAAGLEALDSAPVVRRRVYRLAERLKRGGGERTGVGGAVAQRVVMGPLLDRFGHRRLRLALTGGERIAPGAEEQWRAWGVRLHDIYGTVETSGAAAVLEQGTRELVARPEGVDVTLSGDGEILVSGPCVAATYWKGTEVDRDGDGRLPTGDYGDQSQGLEILGHRDRRLRLADGTAVDPAPIEAVLRSSRYVARAVVVGEGWQGLGVLLEPDMATVASWARRSGVPFSSADMLLREPRVVEQLAGEVAVANRSLSQLGRPQVAAHRLLSRPFAVGADLTPSGTVRDATVGERHGALVDDLRAELAGIAPEERIRDQDHPPSVARPS